MQPDGGYFGVTETLAATYDCYSKGVRWWIISFYHHHHHHICHGVGPLVDPFRSHVSRHLI